MNYFVEEGQIVVDIHDKVEEGQLLVSGLIGKEGQTFKFRQKVSLG